MKIRLDNPRGYTTAEVHAALMRAMKERDESLAHLGERFLRGESSEAYPPHMREAVEDTQLVAWALGEVWDGMATADGRS